MIITECQKSQVRNHRSQSNEAKPDCLKEIRGFFLRPFDCIKLGLPGEKICVFRSDPLCFLEELPKQNEPEEKRESNVGCDKSGCTPSTGNIIKAIEESNDAKVSQS